MKNVQMENGKCNLSLSPLTLITHWPISIIVNSILIPGESMPITKSDVEKIAELARLELTTDETDLFTAQLSSIIGHVEKLNELGTSELLPMSHCAPGGSEFEYAQREDRVMPSLGQKLAVESAPDAESGYFKVPKVIGG